MPTSNDITYSIRRSVRAKRLSVTVYADARVVATAPPTTSVRTIARFVEKYDDWIKQKLTKKKKSVNCIFLPGGRRDYLRHREAVRKMVHDTLQQLNSAYSFTYGRVSIKNLYGRWGSCSAQRNLNFNYKLIHLPPHLAEYIVAHELCHLGEMNHSVRFWKLVAKTIPNHRDCRRELRKYLM
ncbi:TPA: hypothetical protein DEP86_01215 [Candidatus Uhrbacteria bacterium]|nr:hypothetical protein [Candidatus Uhrbacteria bacterium]